MFLATYSNLDNHPAIISTISLRHTLSERKNRKMKKTVSILPTLEESESETSHDNMMNEPNENYNPETVKGTIKRPKNETPEERKLRKMELKERKKVSSSCNFLILLRIVVRIKN